MWPLTKDLILKDPISFSKSTERAWKRDFPSQFWPWPSTCPLMLKDFAGAEITDKPDITANFSYGKQSNKNIYKSFRAIIDKYYRIVLKFPELSQKLSLKLFTKSSLKLSTKLSICSWNCHGFVTDFAQ